MNENICLPVTIEKKEEVYSRQISFTSKSPVASSKGLIATRKSGIISALEICTFQYILQDNDYYLLQDNGFKLIL